VGGPIGRARPRGKGGSVACPAGGRVGSADDAVGGNRQVSTHHLSTDDNYDHSGDSPAVDSGGWVGQSGGPNLKGKGAASLARPEAGSALPTTRWGETGRFPPTICPPTTTRTTAGY